MTRRINGNNGATTMSPTDDTDDDTNAELREAAENVRSGLGVILKHREIIEATTNAEADVLAKRRELAKVEAEHEKAKAAIEANQRQHERRKFDDLAEYDRRIRDAREELEGLTKALAEGEALHERVKAGIAKSKARHEKIEALQADYLKNVARA